MNIKQATDRLHARIQKKVEEVDKLEAQIKRLQAKCKHPKWKRYPQHHGRPDYECKTCGVWK